MASNKTEESRGNKKEAAPSDAYKGISPPAIELPKGGGALKSIDEKFSVNPANGTSSFTFPLPFSSAGGVTPGLGLSYNSGAGNGICGMGWSFSLVSIRRKTEKEIPQYHDQEDSDTFLFSQTEDLVPVLEKSGGVWKKNERQDPTLAYTIRFYRPRVEGLFARIERWTNNSTGIIHWRVLTKDNVTTIFGKSNTAKIFNLENALQIFEWMPEMVYDDKGHCAVYEYRKEGGENIDAGLLHERNRVNGLSKFTNTWLKRIHYGNVQMYTPSMGDTLPAKFLFEAVFDYGDHDKLSAPFAETSTWPYRTDAFSNYHAGFEIRTCRRCERVLFYNHIPELPGGTALVWAVSFGYGNNGIDGFTFLSEIIETGYIKHTDGSYTDKSLPPFAFEYQRHDWNKEVKTISPENLVHAPNGIDEPRYQWIDLMSEGLSGILTEQADSLYYKSNLGEGEFSEAVQISPKPGFKNLQLQELDGNGIKQLVQMGSEPKGFFELDREGKWQSFQPFGQMPSINFKDGRIKQLDLNGDGLADMLISEEDIFTWYPSQGKKGYGAALHTPKMRNEEEGPAIVFNDESQIIFIADINGDGITDIVRIRNGEVCYWPNLGFGHFGAKVSMDHAPAFDSPDQFNTKFIKLADIDGSGTPDIVYFGRNKYRIWMNRQGNSFADPIEIDPFPQLNNSTNISMIDLLGNGVSCIVWNSSLPADAGKPLRYIDLMNGKKPHIMTAYKNNMGKEVYMEYKPSTHYYLEDKKAGHPWITKLHFPVYCVSKQIVHDRIRKLRFASEYSYHHGYYDSIEREFRGFGRTEQTDSEEIDHFVKVSGGMMNNIEEQDLHQPPVLTKSWFHTGAFTDASKILDLFAHEYFQNNQHPEYKMPSPLLESFADTEDWREAMCACKGILLRKEIYALDGTNKKDEPYLVEQHNVLVKRVQEKAVNKHGIFFTHESESIIYHYERDASDPSILHELNTEVDDYGNVIRSVKISYGRAGKDSDLLVSEQDEQAKRHITCTWNDFTDTDLHLDNDYRLPVLWQTRTYEMTGNNSPLAAPYYTYAEMEYASNKLNGTNILYHEIPAAGLTRRLIEWLRTKYRTDDGITPLVFGKLKPRALFHESYKAAFTGALLDQLFNGKTTAVALAPILTAKTAEGGGYVEEDGHFWIPSSQSNYVAANFYLPTIFADAFGKITTIEYGSYNLFISKATDPKSNSISVKQFNYRVLQSTRMEDANLNVSAVRFDELGMVTATFIVGKNTDNGDVFDTTKDETSALDQPGIEYKYFIYEWYNQVLGGLDMGNYYKSKPNYVHLKTWEVHYKFNDKRSTQYEETYVYFDGSGTPLLSKVQAEPGFALKIKNDGTTETIDTSPNKRWIGNGRTILNNKGNPVKQYQPYFSVTPDFDDEKEMTELGFSSVVHYDPLDRPVKTEHANGSSVEVIFSAWKQEHFDENDTIGSGKWNTTMLANLQALPENTPAQIARKNYRIAQHIRTNTNSLLHAGTPSLSYTDSVGRVFLELADNKTGKFKTRTYYDIEGNIRTIKDPMDRVAISFEYDMLSNNVLQQTLDGGHHWSINDVTGHSILAYDDRGFIFTTAYDELRRPSAMFVVEGGSKKMYERFTYGEGAPSDTDNNLRGKLWKQYDQAGISVNGSFDFKGNALHTSRQFCLDYQDTINWDTIAAIALEGDPFESNFEFDALNRPVSMTSPHRTGIPASVLIPGYNVAGLLETLKVDIRNAGSFTEFVTNIDYNAKRQRESIVFKNGARTGYEYDPFTFHLIGMKTTRLMPPATLQDLVYTYDPIGNVTAIRDDAQDEKVYAGEAVSPENEFVYDALYRLIEAQGRKHAGQCLVNHGGVNNNFRNHTFINSPDPNDSDAICNYKEEYTYDEAGNLKKQKHTSAKFGWTRTYKYGIVADDNQNNQLKENDVAGPAMTYNYDPHGNLINLEHLPSMRWNFKDQFKGADLPGSRKVFYVYDGAGRRMRKVIHDDMGRKEKERFYLSGFEIYREYTPAGGIDIERESLHIMDDKHRVALVETLTREKSADIPNPIPLQRYQFNNHSESASLELDDKAAIITYEEYFPFGTTSYQYGRSEKEVQEKRYRYSGKERDEESGLSYFGARYYAPWLARWTGVDPLANKYPGWSPYNFTLNNPLSNTDQDGRAPTPVAIAFHGGARIPGENSAFWFAMKNVQKSYDPSMTKEMHFATTAKAVVATINAKPDDSIARLDFATHGSATGLYMNRHEKTKATGELKEIPKAENEGNSLYASGVARFIESWGNGPEQDLVSSIDYKKFTNDAVVELHGCKAATAPYEPFLDNLSVNISENLFKAGKTDAVVIGHAEKASPNIKGAKTKNADQDYRHGERVVFHNGKVLFRTREKGHIDKAVIKKYLDLKKTTGASYDGEKQVYKVASAVPAKPKAPPAPVKKKTPAAPPKKPAAPAKKKAAPAAPAKKKHKKATHP